MNGKRSFGRRTFIVAQGPLERVGERAQLSPWSLSLKNQRFLQFNIQVNSDRELEYKFDLRGDVTNNGPAPIILFSIDGAALTAPMEGKDGTYTLDSPTDINGTVFVLPSGESDNFGIEWVQTYDESESGEAVESDKARMLSWLCKNGDSGDVEIRLDVSGVVAQSTERYTRAITGVGDCPFYELSDPF